MILSNLSRQAKFIEEFFEEKKLSHLDIQMNDMKDITQRQIW